MNMIRRAYRRGTMGTRSAVWTRRTHHSTRRYGHSVMSRCASFRRAPPVRFWVCSS
ncbi:hypothetical protein EYF80_060536 [Liparis tanakae]|uniref:Uncharacterized protein n=1 Tax=Liparis tanakae TaxID=230148 RepID=A0A4Z2EKD0_9TELE|nr:hypothetical protein EYF80_060536 [Liparis tanakae]